MNSEEPLEELYIDQDELNKERLAKSLKKYIRIDQESGNPQYRKPYHALSTREQIIAYLLYRKAAELLGQIESGKVGVGGKEIAEQTGVNYNTLRGQLSKMDLIRKDKEKGGYLIPTVNLVPAMEEIENGDDEE